MKLTALSALLLATASLPVLADDGLPRGWQGAVDVYQCEPDEWFRNSQNIWQNPTCVNISGGGNAALPVVIEVPEEEDPEEEDPKDPVEPEDPKDPPKDPEDPPVDPCACGDWEPEEPAKA
jgi:hypothetical protein